MARLALVLALALLLAAPAARGATVSVNPASDVRGNRVDEVRYLAAAGEVNRVTVSWSRTEGWVFEEAGAPLVAGSGCAGGGERVTCTTFARDYGSVRLGDGDDDAVVRSTGERPLTVTVLGDAGRDRLGDEGDERRSDFRTFAGGEGDDVLATTGGAGLRGEAGDDTLTGSPHPDWLQGGPGADELRGGGGPDALDPGRDSEADLVDGGAGSDRVDYVGDWQRPIPVSVDLSIPRGAPGDVLRSIEDAVGTYGRDVLVGSRGANSLSGYSGGDTLRGGAGDDDLSGGDGRDRIEGGPGDDRLLGEEERDALFGGPGDDYLHDSSYDPGRTSCGTGRDVLVVHGGPTTPVPGDCERVRIQLGGLGTMNARPAIGGDAAAWSMLCTKFALAEGCRFTVVLRAGGRELGRRNGRIPRSARRTVRVRLGDAGRRFATRGGRLTVVISVTDVGVLRYGVAVPAAR